MVKNNGGAQLGLPPIKHDWDAFDSLPRVLKEIAWESTTQVSTGPHARAELAPEYRRRLHALRVEATRKTYGPDHPQAHFSLAAWRRHMQEQDLASKLELDL